MVTGVWSDKTLIGNSTVCRDPGEICVPAILNEERGRAMGVPWCWVLIDTGAHHAIRTGFLALPLDWHVGYAPQYCGF
jgi:hypothetical protein